MCSKEVQGFKAIPTRFSKDCTSYHELFIKEHSIRHLEENKPPGRTLFVLNVPPYVTGDCLKQIFSTVGKVNSVILQKSITKDEEPSRNGFQVAYVVFQQREHILKALNSSNLSLNEPPFNTGLKKWVEEYNSSICDPEQLQKEINSFMVSFEKNEQKQKKSKTELDDEGWTVVTKKGRKPGVARKESVVIKIKEKIQSKEEKNKKELKNFYTFQIREGKMKNLAALRKNFEDAKKKVNLMKNTRRFKPY